MTRGGLVYSWREQCDTQGACALSRGAGDGGGAATNRAAYWADVFKVSFQLITLSPHRVLLLPCHRWGNRSKRIWPGSSTHYAWIQVRLTQKPVALPHQLRCPPTAQGRHRCAHWAQSSLPPWNHHYYRWWLSTFPHLHSRFPRWFSRWGRRVTCSPGSVQISVVAFAEVSKDRPYF